ncbi:DUF1186 domain-containing protein [Chitinimonas koreensis]|uniref:DUF1186 domain-containing protein n=1 Tax=Chitinimonas koreensis TaxID=356302 RepID=UPI0003F4EF5E|nr:DUF1186 domain-containing protein [Chitinimonas koreensis]
MTATTWDAIRPALEHYDEALPADELAAVLADPGAMAPALLAELAACAADPGPRMDDEAGWMLHLYAINLLAALRDTRAFEPLLAIARLDGDALEALLGDHLTESLPRALAATCDGGEAALQALASDAGAYFWSRAAALRALSLRALEGDYPRAELLAWLSAESEREAQRMVDEDLQPEQGSGSDYLGELVVTLEEIGAGELAETVADWYEDGLIDDGVTSLEDSQQRLARDWEACRADELAHGWGYPRDVIGEIGRWACFNLDEADAEDEDGEAEPQQPVRREEPKVGRNDPCPCGSGKKYKKCCGASA